MKSPAAENYARDRHAFERWQNSRRDEPDEERESNPLVDLLVFLSDGYQKGTLLARALAFLWVLRPDLAADDDGAQSIDAVAAKAGISRLALTTAVRHLRTTAPELDQVMRNVQTSRARFLALAQIKARRRYLDAKDREAMADARRALAHERIRSQRKSSCDREQRKRLRVARELVALADPLRKKAADDMREFDRSMGLRMP